MTTRKSLSPPLHLQLLKHHQFLALVTHTKSFIKAAHYNDIPPSISPAIDEYIRQGARRTIAEYTSTEKSLKMIIKSYVSLSSVGFSGGSDKNRQFQNKYFRQQDLFRLYLYLLFLISSRMRSGVLFLFLCGYSGKGNKTRGAKIINGSLIMTLGNSFSPRQCHISIIFFVSNSY